MPTPTISPTRERRGARGFRVIAHILQIHRVRQRHVARRVEPGDQLLALPAQVGVHVEGIGTPGAGAAEPGLELDRGPVRDHRDRTGCGEPGGWPALGMVAPAAPRGVRLDSHSLRSIPGDRLGGRDGRRREDHDPICRDRRALRPLEGHHPSERAARRERHALDAKRGEQWFVSPGQIGRGQHGKRPSPRAAASAGPVDP